MSMYTVIIKNNSGSEQTIEDLGLVIADATQIEMSQQFNYTEISTSDDLKTLIDAGTLVVNDGTDDLSSADGVKYLTLINKKVLEDDYYSKVQLSSSGQSSVHWDNIINTPAVADTTWDKPVEYRVIDIAASDPTSSSNGDVYANTSDDHYYKYVTNTWVDQGAVAEDDRIINLANAEEDIYSFESGSWVENAQSGDSVCVVVDDDGDGKSAQYIYDTGNSDWTKIGDVDFGHHLDGGDNKHDASEIDVEGSYTYVTGNDVESALSSIDTALSSANDHNTLDDAYDEGGSGSGRIITTDSGSVKLDSGTSGYSPLELTPKTSLPTQGLSDGQFAVKDGIVYIYDNTRSKWISTTRFIVAFGRGGMTKDQFLGHFGDRRFSSNNSGMRMVRNATIVSVSAQLDSSGTCTFYLRKNDNAANIASLGINSALGNGDTSINVDLSSGDFLQCYLNGGFVNDPLILVELAWRE